MAHFYGSSRPPGPRSGILRRGNGNEAKRLPGLSRGDPVCRSGGSEFFRAVRVLPDESILEPFDGSSCRTNMDLVAALSLGAARS
jgi:hypothetical protein